MSKEKKKKESVKEMMENFFDGDDTNSDNVIDRVGHQMVDDSTEAKIDELLHPESGK